MPARYYVALLPNSRLTGSIFKASDPEKVRKALAEFYGEKHKIELRVLGAELVYCDCLDFDKDPDEVALLCWP